MNPPEVTTFTIVTFSLALFAGVIGFLASAILWAHDRHQRRNSHLKRPPSVQPWLTIFFAGITLLLSQIMLGRNSLLPARDDIQVSAVFTAQAFAWLVICAAGGVLTHAISVIRAHRYVAFGASFQQTAAASRHFRFLALLAILLLMQGCAWLTPRPAASTAQEQSVYDVVAPEFLLFSDQDPANDPKLDDATRLDRRNVVTGWSLRTSGVTSSSPPGDIAEKAVYDAIAPDYLLFIDPDPAQHPHFTAVESARAARTVETWRLRLEQERKALNAP